MLKLYNSLTREKEVFHPLEKGKVKIYSCGPTVYNFVHLGNLRAYVFSDVLRRVFRYLGYDVFDVMNITDVDDKTIRASLSLKKKGDPNKILKDFTLDYERYFFEDLDKLNVGRARVVARAAENISYMEKVIGKLFESEFAYVSDDGIYFDLSKYKGYGKLAKIDFSKQRYNRENRMVADEYDKESLQDFVLWKFRKDDEPFWKIVVGGKEYDGRPGWHIECSAMAWRYLGERFDIHTGGVDLRFPHHENEIAQSSSAFENFGVGFWMHNEHLLVDGRKMAKSLNNFYTLRDLEKKGYDVLALREVFLRSHYRAQMNFTFESLKAGEVNVRRINDFYLKLGVMESHSVDSGLADVHEKMKEKFDSALEDDLNTPLALSVFYEFMNEVNKCEKLSKKEIELCLQFVLDADSVFGLLRKEERAPDEVLSLAKKRESARKKKDWKKADELRDEIKKLGWEVRDESDTRSGFVLRRICN